MQTDALYEIDGDVEDNAPSLEDVGVDIVAANKNQYDI